MSIFKGLCNEKRHKNRLNLYISLNYLFYEKGFCRKPADFPLTIKMKKRFLKVCKNPICRKEFGILHDKAGNLGHLMSRCPHCKKLQKIILPVKKKR